LPKKSPGRNRIYNQVMDSQIELHMAAEGLVVKDKESVQRVEDIWLVYQTLYGDNADTKMRIADTRNPMNFFGFGNTRRI